MIGFILGMIVVGLIAGLIARALVSGRDPMSVAATIVLGVVGSFVGGFLADVLFQNDAQDRGLNAAGLVEPRRRLGSHRQRMLSRAENTGPRNR